MRIVSKTKKIVVEQSEITNELILNRLIDLLNIKKIKITDLVTKDKSIKSSEELEYDGSKFSYNLLFEDTSLDWIMLRPNYEGKSFIWISLSDQNLQYIDAITKKIFEIITPISMEYGQQLNDKMVQTPNYGYLDKEYGEFGTESWLGFNIEWIFIVDFKVEIKSKISKEALLKAPAYKVEELDNGCVFVQLTEEEPNPLEIDQKYIDAFIKLYQYCKLNIK